MCIFTIIGLSVVNVNRQNTIRFKEDVFYEKQKMDGIGIGGSHGWLLTACGGGSGTADTTAAAAAADTTAAPAADTTAAADAQAPAGDSTGLSILVHVSPQNLRAQVIKEAVDKFSADTGVAVDVQFKGRTGIRELACPGRRNQR